MDEASEDKAGVIDLIKSMVTVAEIAKLQKYLRANKSGVNVLNKLQLGDDIEAVLGSPKLDTLGMYIHMFNAQAQNRQNKISLSGTLTARYGEDVVGNMLVIEKGFYKTNVIKTNLQAQQLKGWLEIGKSADEVSMYLSFVTAALRDGFGEGELALMVSRVMMETSVSQHFSIASKFEKMLWRRWAENGLDPTSVLVKVFKVDENNVANAGTEVKSIIARYKRFHYDKENGLEDLPKFVDPRRS